MAEKQAKRCFLLLAYKTMILNHGESMVST